MGLPDMAAFQLLWTRLYCMCGCWKGTAIKFFSTRRKLAWDPNIVNVLLIHDYYMRRN